MQPGQHLEIPACDYDASDLEVRNGAPNPIAVKLGSGASEHSFTFLVPVGAVFSIDGPTGRYTGPISAVGLPNGWLPPT